MARPEDVTAAGMVAAECRGGGTYWHHETAIVEPGAEIAPGVVIWHFTHVRAGAQIGMNTRIGKGCYVAEEAVVGARCKVQNGVNLWNGVTCEDDVFIGPQAVFTNVRYPRAYRRAEKWGRTLLKRCCTVGAGAVIVCAEQRTIGEYAFVGAGAVVTHDVPPQTLVAGNPAQFIDFVCMCGHPLRTRGLLIPVEQGHDVYWHALMPDRIVTCQHCSESYRLGDLLDAADGLRRRRDYSWNAK